MLAPVAVEEPLTSAPPSTAFAPRALLTSTSALIVATGVERGLGCFANLLAARLGERQLLAVTRSR